MRASVRPPLSLRRQLRRRRELPLVLLLRGVFAVEVGFGRELTEQQTAAAAVAVAKHGRALSIFFNQSVYICKR